MQKEKIHIDAKKLNEYINQCGIKKTRIAKELGITPVSFSQKITGKVEFKLSEVYRLYKFLDLPLDLMIEIFFTQKVD